MVTNGSYSEIRFSEFLRSAISLQEEALEFAFKVGGEDVLTDGFTDLLHSPETATVKLVGRRAHGTVVDSLVNIDKLTLPLAVEYILPDRLRLEVQNTEFLTHLTLQGLLGRLAVVDMSANGSVPLARLDILPRRTLLEIDLTTGIEHMQMDDGMQQMGSVVTIATGSRPRDISRLIDDRKYFLIIIFHIFTNETCHRQFFLDIPYLK